MSRFRFYNDGRQVAWQQAYSYLRKAFMDGGHRQFQVVYSAEGNALDVKSPGLVRLADALMLVKERAMGK